LFQHAFFSRGISNIHVLDPLRMKYKYFMPASHHASYPSETAYRYFYYPVVILTANQFGEPRLHQLLHSQTHHRWSGFQTDAFLKFVLDHFGTESPSPIISPQWLQDLLVYPRAIVWFYRTQQ